MAKLKPLDKCLPYCQYCGQDLPWPGFPLTRTERHVLNAAIKSNRKFHSIKAFARHIDLTDGHVSDVIKSINDKFYRRKLGIRINIYPLRVVVEKSIPESYFQGMGI